MFLREFFSHISAYCLLLSYLTYSSAPNMEATCSYETSVDFKGLCGVIS
jgi:hypothetical protein